MKLFILPILASFAFNFALDPLTSSFYCWQADANMTDPLPSVSYPWKADANMIDPLPSASYPWKADANMIDPLPSASYPWKADATIFKGSGAILRYHELKGHTMKAGDMKFYQADHMERFFIVKKGPVEVVLGGQKYTINKGSVIFLLPGDKVVFGTDGRNNVELYEMVYASKQKPDSARGKAAGESFVMNWDDMVFKPHDKGGVRQLFDRKTVMFNRFDIHITTLNAGFKSHEPHTHQNEEILLMLDGNAEMTVNTGKVRCNTGDAVYVGSMVPHNLINTGKGTATYFAIQWN